MLRFASCFPFLCTVCDRFSTLTLYTLGLGNIRASRLDPKRMFFEILVLFVSVGVLVKIRCGGLPPSDKYRDYGLAPD